MNEKKKKEEKAIKHQSAKEVAEAMVENMKANMADPNFLNEKERIASEAAKEVLDKRRQREEADKN